MCIRLSISLTWDESRFRYVLVSDGVVVTWIFHKCTYGYAESHYEPHTGYAMYVPHIHLELHVQQVYVEPLKSLIAGTNGVDDNFGIVEYYAVL
jgi:hypothetical protein